MYELVAEYEEIGKHYYNLCGMITTILFPRFFNSSVVKEERHEKLRSVVANEL